MDSKRKIKIWGTVLMVVVAAGILVYTVMNGNTKRLQGDLMKLNGGTFDVNADNAYSKDKISGATGGVAAVFTFKNNTNDAIGITAIDIQNTGSDNVDSDVENITLLQTQDDLSKIDESNFKNSQIAPNKWFAQSVVEWVGGTAYFPDANIFKVQPGDTAKIAVYVKIKKDIQKPGTVKLQLNSLKTGAGDLIKPQNVVSGEVTADLPQLNDEFKKYCTDNDGYYDDNKNRCNYNGGFYSSDQKGEIDSEIAKIKSCGDIHQVDLCGKNTQQLSCDWTEKNECVDKGQGGDQGQPPDCSGIQDENIKALCQKSVDYIPSGKSTLSQAKFDNKSAHDGYDGALKYKDDPGAQEQLDTAAGLLKESDTALANAQSALDDINDLIDKTLGKKPPANGLDISMNHLGGDQGMVAQNSQLASSKADDARVPIMSVMGPHICDGNNCDDVKKQLAELKKIQDFGDLCNKTRDATWEQISATCTYKGEDFKTIEDLQKKLAEKAQEIKPLPEISLKDFCAKYKGTWDEAKTKCTLDKNLEYDDLTNPVSWYSTMYQKGEFPFEDVCAATQGDIKQEANMTDCFTAGQDYFKEITSDTVALFYLALKTTQTGKDALSLKNKMMKELCDGGKNAGAVWNDDGKGNLSCTIGKNNYNSPGAIKQALNDQLPLLQSSLDTQFTKKQIFADTESVVASFTVKNIAGKNLDIQSIEMKKTGDLKDEEIKSFMIFKDIPAPDTVLFDTDNLPDFSKNIPLGKMTNGSIQWKWPADDPNNRTLLFTLEKDKSVTLSVLFNLDPATKATTTSLELSSIGTLVGSVDLHIKGPQISIKPPQYDELKKLCADNKGFFRQTHMGDEQQNGKRGPHCLLEKAEYYTVQDLKTKLGIVTPPPPPPPPPAPAPAPGNHGSAPPPSPTPAPAPPPTPAPGTPPPAAVSCESKGKFTYTGPAKPGERTPGMCIDCANDIYIKNGGSCQVTKAPPAAGQTPQSKPATTTTSKAGTGGSQQSISQGSTQGGSVAGSAAGSTKAGASGSALAQSAAGSTSGVSADFHGAAGSPTLNSSQRLTYVPERGKTGPEMSLYLSAVFAANGIAFYLRRKKKSQK